MTSTVTISVNGRNVQAPPGQSVAAALIAAGETTFRTTSLRNSPRSVFCGMGVCYDCLVSIDGQTGRRACMTSIREGMMIETGGVAG
jgi:predicted molibdopterin-dependent oxidoreductase YjgC